MKIMVVDDVGLIRHKLDSMLSGHGYAVVTAANAAEALQNLKNDPGIRAVLTDLIMPGLNGVELAVAARGIQYVGDDGATSSPPAFLLMTASRPDGHSAESILMQQAIDLGFAAILQKPVHEEDLFHHFEAIEKMESSDEPSTLHQVVEALKKEKMDKAGLTKLRDELQGELELLNKMIAN